MRIFETQVRNVDDLERVWAERNKGSFLSEATQIKEEPISGDAYIFEHNNRKIEFSTCKNVRVRGLVSDQFFAIGAFLRSGPRNSIGNENLLSGDIGWLPANLERAAVYAEPVEGVLLLLRYDELTEMLTRRGVEQIGDEFKYGNLLRLPEDTQTLICRSLERQTRALVSSAASISEQTFDYVFEHLIDVFVDAISFGVEINCRVQETSIDHHRAVNRTEDFLSAHAEQLPTLDKISGELGISRRTLHRAFTDVCDVTPNTYLRHWRLTRAREEIRDGKSASVTETALRWGFLDVGRFAGYYRKLFDELPSETLARSKLA
ncbi:helix-turn-helix transcriptional regulator [Labrenzia sp. PHM005]|uniref:helix-turn-helix transcriptional regulator n=1 Tax=Labrenzia sp. PHM005 TaxID=2590016 RepID=UPI0011402383|nr:helix-turn-helix transcriptional regulator [Labrenzia sp. PHM005]QDG77621.1 helix-turn-helix transcriptional regulator [Labrenzia sp. PHM005]